MANKKFWLGMLAVSLTFVLTVTGCDDGDGNSSIPALTGTVIIDNTSPKVGDILTATYSGGNGTGTATWQWIQGESTNIGTNNNTYTVTAADEGKTIKVRVSFANQGGNITSAATGLVTANNLPALTGTVVINNMSPKVGDILTATYSGGNGTGTATWQWIQGESTNIGTNSNTYTVVAADEGKTIKVRVSFANQSGNKTSDATGIVAAVDNRPVLTGSVAIDNTSPKVGDILTATYSGGNGTGTATWQWIRGESTNIAGATGNSYTVVEDDWGKTIKVQVSFADQINSVAGTATAAVQGGALSQAKWTSILQAIQDDASFDGTLDLSGYTRTATSADTLNSSGTFDPSGGNTGKGKIKSIILPDAAVALASNAFSSSSGFTILETVTGVNITSIGTSSAFQPANTTLKSIVFPKVTSIPNDAFNGCTALETAQFITTTSIGNNAFKGCTKLKTIDFSAATSIGTNAFENCAALITVTFPKVTTLGGNAFLNCANLDRATFSVATTVGGNAFEGCAKLARVDLNLVTSIGANAFSGAGKQFRPTMINNSTPAFTVYLGKTPPQLGTRLFGDTSSLGATYINVYVPDDADVSAYLGSFADDGGISGTDSSNVWVNGFRGAGWNASGSVITAGFRNSNVTVKMYYDF